MAKPSRIITLNLGSQSIELAEFQIQPRGGLILCSYRSREVFADPATETARQTHIAAAVREMMNELGIKRGPVNYTVAEESVFTRFVKLPALEEEKIERIISFEAQQNVPFPIDEVVWDYQLVGAGVDQQIQVVLVAIKTDLLEQINELVEGAGLRTRIVDLAPMAIYNAFRYSYNDFTDCTLLVDIGARTTNLLFVEPGKFFSRSVPIGGASITAAIAKEFGESLAAAEARKKRNGFVSPGGTFAQAEASDADVERVLNIARTTMARLYAEVMRSISHYRTQQQGSPPQRLLLCGGSASMPLVHEFFEEKLQVPVESFNPLRNIAVMELALPGELRSSAHLLGELVGLALRSVARCPMELNLRPASVVQRHEMEKKQPFLVAAAVCFILILLGWTFYYLRATQIAKQCAERIQPKVALMRAADKRLDKLRKETSALDRAATPLIAVVNARGYWVNLLDDLNSRLPPEDIWITELIPLSAGKAAVGVDEKRRAGISAAIGVRPATSTTKAGTSKATIDAVLVRGLYMYNPKQEQLVTEFFQKLTGSPYFSVRPGDQARVIKSTIPTNTEWAYPYELHLDLHTPLPLP